MSERQVTTIDRLAAPTNDGEILVWPQAGRLEALALRNREIRRTILGAVIDGLPRSVVDSALSAPPIIMSGHQPEFLHPGVWAKSVVSTRLAARLGGTAEFLVVDHDAPHDIALAWPHSAQRPLRRHREVLLGNPAELAYESLPRIAIDAWRALFARVPDELRGSADTLLATFESAFLGESRGDESDRGANGLDYVSAWIDGMRAIDASLGIESPRFTRVGTVFANHGARGADEAAAFVVHLLLRARDFATAYNGALARYRDRRGIRGNRHPIPDLVIDEQRAELPFWAWHELTGRKRLSVGVDSTEVRLWAGADHIGRIQIADLTDDPKAAMADLLAEWHVRPRALALTLFARLLLCDLFIHGIGGAKYDQITDDIVRTFWNIEPPAFACVSATVHLPLERTMTTEADVREHAERVRDLRFNPQRHLPFDDAPEPVQRQLEARRKAVELSRRLAVEDPRNRSARREAFSHIRAASGDLLASMPDLLLAARQALADADARLRDDAVAARRDWFLGLYPASKLRSLCDALPLA